MTIKLILCMLFIMDVFLSGAGGLIAPSIGARAIVGSTSNYELASGPIHLVDIECRGDETHLFNCTSPQLFVQHNCNHFEDAGVDCEGECSPIARRGRVPVIGLLVAW